jgi:hypothetical protein
MVVSASDREVSIEMVGLTIGREENSKAEVSLGGGRADALCEVASAFGGDDDDEDMVWAEGNRSRPARMIVRQIGAETRMLRTEVKHTPEADSGDGTAGSAE